MKATEIIDKAKINLGLDKSSSVVAVIRLIGPIGQVGPVKYGMNLSSLENHIKKAFSLPRLKAVALQINCPGGAPVQTSLIYRKMRALSAKKEIPIYSFVEDVAASGGYWLACTGDEIYVDESSIVGSIGVVSASFGFKKLIEKAGIERRVYSAGDEKSFLDPFKDEDPKDLKRLENLQKSIHDTFKDLVRERRADKLSANENELFNGSIWTGKQACDLGLADEIGDIRSVMEEKFGEDVAIKVVNPEKKKAIPLVSRGSLYKETMHEALKLFIEKSYWSRFGL